jgi:nucleotide-binding universal stress UspA family protein
MFKHILVPLDGSKMAEAALPAAAFLSGRFNSSVTLFHVIEKNAPGEIHGQSHLKDAGEAEVYLTDTVRRTFAGDVHTDFHVHATESDNVAESIVGHAHELESDLIVMCSHGRGWALHMLLGSIAQRVVSKGDLPVLIAHPGKDGGAQPFSCDTVLLPLDGDIDHEKALPVSMELAKVCNASLNLAMVVPGFGELSGEKAAASRFLPGTMTRILELSAENAKEYLKASLETIHGNGLVAEGRVLRGDPASALDSASRDMRADLIVMATHGKSAMDAFWAGSVTHKLSGLSRIPLLLIPIRKD